MAQVLVRNLDDRVVETYRRRAAAKGVSLEAELRVTLSEAAKLTREEKRAMMLATLEHNRRLLNPASSQTPAWIMIREDRDHGH
jgi:plasmid stability protein